MITAGKIPKYELKIKDSINPKKEILIKFLSRLPHWPILSPITTRCFNYTTEKKGNYPCLNYIYGLLVLVPGFEPGSTDRESVMMDRTTLHELANRSAGQKFMKSTLISRNYHFHFHLDHSFGHSYAESDCCDS